MKLSPRDAGAYFRRPDPAKAGLLLYGSDPMRIAGRRQEVVAALIGPTGEAEMRLARLQGADLRKDPAALLDAVKAQGFFPGPRVALVEEATDGLAGVIETALGDWAPGDAQIVVTAGQLTARSALRKLFEKHPAVHAAGIYDDPPSRDEIERMLAEAGLARVSRDGREALLALSRDLGPGDFRQVLEKLALYKRGDETEATVDEVAAVAPQSVEAGIDDLFAAVADGRPDAIGPLLRRLHAQGTAPVGVCIALTRAFRQLHAAASDPGGPAAGAGRLRPPVFGPRRDRLVRQASNWGTDRLETALEVLTDTDLQLRSSSAAPDRALTERALIRLAMLARAS